MNPPPIGWDGKGWTAARALSADALLKRLDALVTGFALSLGAVPVRPAAAADEPARRGPEAGKAAAGLNADPGRLPP